MSTARRLRKHRVAMFAIGLMLPACHSPATEVIRAHPPYSRLAGRWSATVREILGHAFSDEDLGETEWSLLDERVVVATVSPDGRFDWSRTWLGVVLGIHGLCEPGDQCRVRRFGGAEYEVISAEYAPTKSLIEVAEVPHQDGTYNLMSYLQMELQLQSQHRALAQIVTDGPYPLGASPERPTPPSGPIDYSTPYSWTLTLARHDDAPQKRKRVRSSIAGTWAEYPDSYRAVLVIRADGTFDWTATDGGIFGSFYQLDHSGDRAVGVFAGQLHEVVDAKYRPNESRIKVRSWRRDDPSVDQMFELVAKAAGPNAIRVRVRTTADDGRRERLAATLYRNECAREREEDVLDAVRRAGEVQ
jgi:hypothetical protein